MLLLWVREGLPTPDEGYLWYGSQRTLAGETPLRGFRSYEPGRYYWCAAWLRVLGQGLAPIRIAVQAFYFLGLTCGLFALRLAGIGWPAVVAAGIVLVAWEHTPYSLFEPALTMFAVLGGVGMIIYPGYWAILVAGAVAGLASFFGVNYGLYAGAALLLLTMLEGLKSSSVEFLPSLGVFLAGGLLGALPLLVMFLGVPGVFAAFFERRVRAVVSRRRSNLPLAVPWPWRAAPAAIYGLGWGGWRLVDRAVGRVTGLYFVLLPAFAWPIVVWAALSPWSQIRAHAALVAAASLGAFTLHHAFSRADLYHLPQAMPPFVIGMIALAGHGLGWIVLALILGAGTTVIVLAAHPRIERYRHRSAYVRCEIGGSPIWIIRASGMLIETLRSVAQDRLEPSEPLLAVPTLAELFPILSRRSAVYDTYCVYPANEREQTSMLRDIQDQGVRLAVVREAPLDGREELRFSRTHPLVWEHLITEFEALDLEGIPDDLHVFYRGWSANEGVNLRSP